MQTVRLCSVLPPPGRALLAMAAGGRHAAALVAAAAAVSATLVLLHRRRRSTAAPVQEEELIAVLARARQLGLLTERAEDLLWNALDDSETTVEALVAQWTARIEAAESAPRCAEPSLLDAEPAHGTELSGGLPE